jgi:transcriptional regulator with XRE-family HTH domain
VENLMSVEDGFRPLQERMNALQMRLAHLSAQVGISRGTMSQYASGLAPLSYLAFKRIDRILTICEALQARTALPINWQDAPRLKAAIEEYENEQRTPPSELQRTDWDLLASVIASKDPATVTSNLGISSAELLRRLEETSRRFDGVIESIRKSNQDKGALTKIVNDELEVRRIERQ